MGAPNEETLLVAAEALRRAISECDRLSAEMEIRKRASDEADMATGAARMRVDEARKALYLAAIGIGAVP